MSKRATVVFILATAMIPIRAAAWTECTRPMFFGGAKNVVLNAEVTRARLPIAVDALQAKAELVLRNIRFDAHPGMQFNVFLERTGDRAKRVRVGTLSFYMPTKTRVIPSRTFDVTDELRQIGGAGDLADVNVVFEATTGRGGANANATFDPKSKLTIGEIELRAKAK